jgi:hydrogenase maturation protease
MEQSKILVLGVGNILMSDEGAGVRAIERLQRDFTFADNVRLLDGGTLGTRLIDPISQADRLIVIDVALRGHPAGTITRLTYDEIRSGIVAKNSMHQVSFTETLALAELLDMLPPTVIVAVEPKDIETMSVELTKTIADAMDLLCEKVLEEIVFAGGSFHNKTAIV